MIPKIIHFCWFGGNPYPEKVKHCIESWKQMLPDYKIKEWNEANFDINCNDYVRQAYEARKYAFVSDYARFYILYNHGGIYLDTDVEVLKNLDYFLQYEVFAGFEGKEGVATGLILGSTPNSDIIKEMLDHYKNEQFLNKEDGSRNYTTVVKRVTDILVKHGLKLDGTRQNVAGIEIFPKDYFAPMDFITKKTHITENTYTIHHYAATWHSPYQKLVVKVRGLVGEKTFRKLLSLKKRLIN